MTKGIIIDKNLEKRKEVFYEKQKDGF